MRFVKHWRMENVVTMKGEDTMMKRGQGYK